jgi:predicted Na+-dependent transporter
MSTLSETIAPLKRLRNVLLVLLAVVAGVLFPQGAPVVQRLTLLIVTFLVYSSLVGVSVDRDSVARSVLPVAGVLFVSYVVVPLVGGTWVGLFLSDGMALGVAAILATPATAGSAIVWTRVARGNVELAGIATLSSLAVAPLLTPLVLAQLTTRSIAVPIGSLGTDLLIVTVTAVVLLVVVPTDAVNEGTMRYAAALSIALLIYAGVGVTGTVPTSFVMLGRIGLVAIVVFAAGLVSGVLIVRLLDGTREDLVAVFFSGTLKNLGVSMLIVLSVSSQVAIFAVVGYYISQQVASALLVDTAAFGTDALSPAFR